MKLIYLFFLLILVFLFAGCTDTNESADVSGNNVDGSIENFSGISCDDNNQCTEDFFDKELGDCRYKRLDHCCGDNFCDPDEGCELEKHETKCPGDCPKSCPAFVVVGEFECSGDCEKLGENYTLSGDSRFTINLKNLGELPLYGIKSKVNCNNNRGITILSNTKGEKGFGVSVRDYFGKNEDTTFLSGIDFEKNKIDYSIEFNGKPEKNMDLGCSVSFIAPDYFYNAKLNINFEIQ